MKPIKIIVLGDVEIGKTSMLLTFTKREYPKEYIPISTDHYVCSVRLGNKKINATLWEIGDGEYENLRILNYPNTDMFVLCYSVTNRKSFENILHNWYPELQANCPEVPVILVATKNDSRTQNRKVVSTEEGKQLKKDIGAVDFLEVSAKNNEKIDQVFEVAIKKVIRSKLCCIKRLIMC